LYFLDIPQPSPGNTVNMVDIWEHHEGLVHTLLEDGDSSTGSTRSVCTEPQHLEDDEYGLDPLPYPPGFSPIPRFPQDVVTWCSMSAMTSPQSWEKLTSNGNFANSVTPIALNAVIRRVKKKKHIAGDPDLEI
jgi:hypothetical protein